MRNQERVSEVYRGHLSECFRHFGRLFRSKVRTRSRGRTNLAKPMVDFFQASAQTVLRWLDDEFSALPRGEAGLKLLCYLDLHGYRVIELEHMDIPLRYLTELIGFSVISGKEAAKLLGYHDAQQIYAVVAGTDGVSAEKKDHMYEIWKDKKDLLDTKKQQAFEKSRLEFLFKSDPAASPTANAVFTILEEAIGLVEHLSESEISAFDDNITGLITRLRNLRSKTSPKKVVSHG